MLTCMQKLNDSPLNDFTIETFMHQIDVILKRIQVLKLHDLVTDSDLIINNKHCLFSQNFDLNGMTNMIQTETELPIWSGETVLSNKKTHEPDTLESIYVQNIQSIPAKDGIFDALDTTLYRILCFTETWLKAKHKTEHYFPQKFQVYRHDRDDINSIHNRGGGVAILVNSELRSLRLRDLEDDSIEGVCVKVWLNVKTIIIYTLYVPERINDRSDVFKKHAACIKKICDSTTSNVFVIGDLNMRGVKWLLDETETYLMPLHIPLNEKLGFEDFIDNVSSLSLQQYCSIENDHGNVLDLVFARGGMEVMVIEALSPLLDMSDLNIPHPSLEVRLDLDTGHSMSDLNDEYTEILIYSRGNYEKIISQLNQINFAHVFSQMNVTEAFDYFYGKLNEFITSNIPTKKVKTLKKPKWWSKELNKLKNKRDKAWKKRDKPGHDELFKEIDKAYKLLMSQLQNEYIKKIEENILNEPAQFWNFARERNKNSNYPSVMRYGIEIIDKPHSIVEAFANSFSSYFQIDNETLNIEELLVHCTQESTEINVNMFDIDKAIDEIRINGPVGADGISPKILHMCRSALIWPLWILFQKSFKSGCLPDFLKKSRIIPIHKKGDKAVIGNYRMVAIGTLVLMVLEKAVKNVITAQIGNKLSKFQHGFRKGRSVTSNLLGLSIAAHEAFANGNQLDVFYGDFEKAFDRVNHKILINKLIKVGLGPQTIRWIAAFLMKRGNYVQIGKHKSKLFFSDSGVGAGTSIGPVLFLLFINDLPEHIKCVKTLMFADDVKLYIEIKSRAEVLKLKLDIARLSKWCHTNRLHLNVEKCHILTLSQKNKENIVYSDYKINGKQIGKVDEIRDLGIILDEKLSFGPHIKNLIASSRQMMGYIKWISAGRFNERTLMLLYVSYVRSKLEFAVTIWDPHKKKQILDLESVQKRFLLYLLGDDKRKPPYKLPPYTTRLQWVDLQPLCVRRTIAKTMIGYDIVKGPRDDPNVSCKIVNNERAISTRLRNPLLREKYVNQIHEKQPINEIIRLINKYRDCFWNAATRNSFKQLISQKILNEYYDDNSNNFV